ncbi:hypothetical protein IWX49DRAFT_589265 [Phyllosticta citricarpa]|uniref:Uncharacterized protein n=1 Tax=Phyllosticta paracitricarpa TaxID=2016321 RepID=A0ABR1NIG2_9PEZI
MTIDRKTLDAAYEKDTAIDDRAKGLQEVVEKRLADLEAEKERLLGLNRQPSALRQDSASMLQDEIKAAQMMAEQQHEAGVGPDGRATGTKFKVFKDFASNTFKAVVYEFIEGGN